jgi:hypothetical protein
VAAESILLSTILGEYSLLHASFVRFIIFDGAGVLILIGALFLIKSQPYEQLNEISPN